MSKNSLPPSPLLGLCFKRGNAILRGFFVCFTVDLYQRRVLPEIWEEEELLSFCLLRKGLPPAQADLEFAVSLGRAGIAR